MHSLDEGDVDDPDNVREEACPQYTCIKEADYLSCIRRVLSSILAIVRHQGARVN